MIKGAIFDLDGTLFDSMFIWDTIGSDYLHSIGYQPKENLGNVVKTSSLYQVACHFKSEYGVSLSLDEIMNGVNNMVEKYYKYEVLLKPGISEFLKRLKENNVKMCIATATDKHLVEMATERCGIRKYFSEIFTCTAVGHGKNEPNIYREALKHLDTDKSQTVIFEDALYAIKTAKKDGFITTGILDCHEKNQTEVQSISDFYITDFNDCEAFWLFATKL